MYIFIHNGNNIVFNEIINKTQHIPKLINSIYDIKIQTLLSPNTGMDPGGFLRLTKHALDNKLDTDYIFVTHTKTDNKWRSELFDPLIDNIDLIKDFMDKNPNVGLVGANKHICPWLKGSNPNFEHVSHILKHFSINIEDHIKINKSTTNDIKTIIRFNPKFKIFMYAKFGDKLKPLCDDRYQVNCLRHKMNISVIEKFVTSSPLFNRFCKYKNNDDFSNEFYFVGGTMFIVRWSLVREIFKNINMDDMINELPEGKPSDYGDFIFGDKSQLPHAWERVICILIKLNNKHICGFDGDFHFY
jgi:hypothetical protein